MANIGVLLLLPLLWVTIQRDVLALGQLSPPATATATDTALDSYDPHGWTPRPTHAPLFAHFPRQYINSGDTTFITDCVTTSAATCGYENSNYSKSPSAPTPGTVLTQ